MFYNIKFKRIVFNFMKYELEIKYYIIVIKMSKSTIFKIAIKV